MQYIKLYKGQPFWIRADLWKHQYKPWPVPGDITEQYFQGIIQKIDKSNHTKVSYTRPCPEINQEINIFLKIIHFLVSCTLYILNEGLVHFEI